MRSNVASKIVLRPGDDVPGSPAPNAATVYSDLHIRRWLAITAVVVTFIVYGSLYPFEFRWHVGGAGPLHSLLQGWNARPGRGDFLANVLLYCPFGLFFTLAIRRQAGAGPAAVLVFLAGTSLSITMEMLQYFDPGRVTAASDVYSNALGTAVGIPLALLFRARYSRQSARTTFHPAPLLLLTAWAVDRLYPFIPVIDLHKYWNALKPVVFTTPISVLDVLRHIAIWWTVALLLEKTGNKKGAPLHFAAFATTLLVGQVLIMDGALSKPELIGVAVAVAGAFSISYPIRLRLGFVCLLGYVIFDRLAPLQLRPVPSHFGWIPFQSFMEGSLTVNALSFLEKSVLYGSLIWLLQELGVTRFRATVIIGLLIAATAVADIYISDHSPQITDPMLAILIGSIMPSRAPVKKA